MKCWLSFAVAAILASGSAAFGATLHVDTFNADTLGWTGGPGPAFVATGGAGDGGGFLLQTPGTNFATYNIQPAWIGDYAGIGADRVLVDMMSPLDSGSALEMRLVLFGPGSTGERWTSTVAQTVSNDGVWRHYTFMIRAGDLAHVQGTSTYDQLMSGAVRVMLRHDPGAPNPNGEFVEAKLGIDNVELASAPSIPGDFDGSGHVDGADLTNPTLGFLARYGNDLDGNSFLTWQQNFGEPQSVGSQFAVPEPGAGGLLLAAAALGIRRRTKIA